MTDERLAAWLSAFDAQDEAEWEDKPHVIVAFDREFIDGGLPWEGVPPFCIGLFPDRMSALIACERHEHNLNDKLPEGRPGWKVLPMVVNGTHELEVPSPRGR